MTHRLILEEPHGLDDVEGLARNLYPQVRREENILHMTDTARMHWNEEARTVLLDVPVERADASLEVAPDAYGLAQAFPDGAPDGEELFLLEFSLGVARRLGGSLVTDTGVTLTPHRFMDPDLQVVAPYQLRPEQTLEILREIVKESEIEGGEEDAEVYSILMPIFPDADLQVHVEPLEYDIPAVSHVDWVREGAVSYQVLYQPTEPGPDALTEPDSVQVKAWREAYMGCAAIAKKIHDVTGGFVMDFEGFLVDPEDLF